MSTTITLPAGRSFRRSQSAKWVDPQPEKGTIEIRPDQGIITFRKVAISCLADVSLA